MKNGIGKFVIPVTLMILLPIIACEKRIGGLASRYEDAFKKGTPILTAYTSLWDHGQYHDACSGTTHAVMGDEWTSTIFDTDSDYGGCFFYFFVRDTPGGIELSPLTLAAVFEPISGAGPSECRNTGRHEIPILPEREMPGLRPMVLDTDDEQGGCKLTFIVEGRNDIGLDIKYMPNGNSFEQCINRTETGKYHTAKLNNSVTIGLDLDNRYGGCKLELRLRHLDAG